MRAASALLFFLLTWLSVPAAMLAQQPDTCAMECCVAEGHCCCAAQKLWVEGQDHSGVREIGQPEMEASCPCPATPPSTAKIFSRRNVQTALYVPAAEHQLPPINRGRESFYRSPRFTPKSPRGPPSLLLNA